MNAFLMETKSFSVQTVQYFDSDSFTHITYDHKFFFHETLRTMVGKLNINR